MVPQCICDLLNDLKKVKKAFPLEREQPGEKGKANLSHSGKHKMITIHQPIPKKPYKEAKHCALCKKHGGVHTTHNLSDWRKYKKEGKIKKISEKGQRGSTAYKKKTASAFAKLLHSFWLRLRSLRRQTRSSRRARISASTITTATAMISTPFDGAGPVTHGDTTVVKLN